MRGNYKWTKELCHDEAKKYMTRIEFSKKSKNAYQSALYNGWLDDICLHMTKLLHDWSLENCRIESLKYTSKSEWKISSPSSYQSSLKNGWHNKLTTHMIELGNKYKRMVYEFKFPDNSIYVGITHNPKQRKREHLGLTKKKKNNSSVLEYFKKTNLKPEYKQLTDFIDVDKAKLKEEEFVEKYRKLRFNVLNKVKTGGIGGNTIKWTKEKCKKEALKYENKKQFFKFAIGAYSSSKKNGWFEEICSHMRRPKVWNKIWDMISCLNVSLTCKTKKDFRLNFNSAYDAAQRNNWLSEIYKKNNW